MLFGLSSYLSFIQYQTTKRADNKTSQPVSMIHLVRAPTTFTLPGLLLLGVVCASGGRIEWPAINVTDSKASVTLDYIINAICSDSNPEPEFIYLTFDHGVLELQLSDYSTLLMAGHFQPGVSP